MDVALVCARGTRVEATYASSAREVTTDVIDVVRRRSNARASTTTRALTTTEGDARETMVWARARVGKGVAMARGRGGATLAGGGRRTSGRDARATALSFTNDGEGLAIAYDNGEVVVVDASDGSEIWAREVGRDGRAAASARASAGEDVSRGDVAVTYDDERFVYVVPRDANEIVSALRHPARVESMSWRRQSLATLCRDGAIRLWLRAERGQGSAQLACTIQTPYGGLNPLVSFDWLETSEISDVMYDHAIIGLDGACGVHVWTISDANTSHPLCARRPVVAHRGSMSLERKTMTASFDDKVVIRGSLTQSKDDICIAIASRNFGIVVARVDSNRPNILEQLHNVALRGHASNIVDMRVHSQNEELVTIDASGVRNVWRRDQTGALSVSDEAGEVPKRAPRDDIRVKQACSAVGAIDGELSDDGRKLAFIDDAGGCAVGVILSEIDVVIERLEVANNNPAVKRLFRWFDVGCGIHALAVAINTEISVYAPSTTLSASKGASWRCVARVAVAGDVVSAMEWSRLGDAIYVATERSIHIVTCDGGLAKCVVEESRSLPSYHPCVLLDWLEDGRAARVRKSLRAVVAYLKAGDFCTPCPSMLPRDIIATNESTSETVDQAPDSTRAPAPVSVPEFDMSAFGSFGGVSTTPTATFAFGSDAESTPMMGLSTTSPSPHTKRSVCDIFTQEEAEIATELVSAHANTLQLAPTESVRLLGVIDAVRALDSRVHVQLDEAARRFATIWHTRRLRRSTDNENPCGEELCWAIQSATTTEVLDDLTNDECGVKADWRIIKRLGVPIWLRKDEDLRVMIEKCAKEEFSRTKNADDCALFFVLVDRVKVLAGLYKATQNIRLYEFMSRDFSEQRHREAALKNGYALLSKHRYEFAAAFFILGGQPLDAASIVWKHKRDLSLTLTIARLTGLGDDEAPRVGRFRTEVASMLKNDVVPAMSDSWTLMALHWLIGETDDFIATAASLVETHDHKAGDYVKFISTSRDCDSNVVSRAQSMVNRSSAKLAHALESLGAPLAALERFPSHLTRYTDDAERIASASLSSVGLAREITDEDIGVFAQAPWNVSVADVQKLLRRRWEVEDFKGFIAESVDEPTESSSPTELHTRTRSVLPTEVKTVCIPRVPSGQDLSVDSSPTEKVARAQNAFSKLRRLSVKIKSQRSEKGSPSTPSSPTQAINHSSFGLDDNTQRVFRTPVTVATMQNDGFYDMCFNHEVPYEIGLASVRQGLSVVNLRKLNESKAESESDAWAVLLRAQPPISGFKSSMNSWLHHDETPSTPTSPRHGNVREHDWATHAGLDMTSLTGIIPHAQSEPVGRNRSAIKREPANDVVARSVASHPSRSFFAVGTSYGGVQLWDFHGKNADHAAAVLSLGGKKSTSGTGASTRAVAWSPYGARLAACTSDGNVTLWLGDAPDVEPAASKNCGFKGCKSEDVLFLSTNLLATASSTGSVSSVLPESVVLWDALQPAHASPGIIRAHAGGCTALSQFPSLTAPHGVPWPFLITGGSGGDVAAHDLRMLGGDDDSTILWRSRLPQSGSIAAIAAIHHEITPLIITGDQFGDVHAYSALDGDRVAAIAQAHPRQKFLTPRGGGAVASVGVAACVPIHNGVLTAGGDGTVRCFRLDESFRRL